MSRTYDINGAEYVSVTTVLGDILGKPGLQQWAAKMAAEWAADNPHISTDVYGVPREQWVAECAGAAQRYSADAMWTGSKVHRAIKWHCLYGRELTRGRVTGEVYNGYSAWLNWVREHNVRIIESEKTVQNINLCYAGTLDAVAEVDGDLCVVDYKTSTFYSSPSHPMQVAAYRNCVGKRLSCLGAVVLLNKKTGDYKMKKISADELDLFYECFVSALNLWYRCKAREIKNERADGIKKLWQEARK